ncbi:MAG: sugar phosphate nucleotidyltransferase [Thermoplasmatales archaeon]
MKAIITAAGLGKRSGLNGLMRKELLNVYDFRDGTLQLRPIIDVLISKLFRSGINEIAVVLDPADIISQDYIRKIFPSVALYFQRERNGFGDALLSAKDFVGNEGFILAAGDGMILDLEDLRGPIEESIRNSRWTLFVMRVDDPRRYGVAEIEKMNGFNKVRGVVEKPEVPPSNFALCALYHLPHQIFDFISYKEGKAELTDAIARCIDSGMIFSAVEVPRTSWVSVGIAEDYRHVLESTYRYATKLSGLKYISKP